MLPSRLQTTGETAQKFTFPDLRIQRSSNKMPQLHKTEYSYKILSRLNSYTLPAFYWRIIDQVVIIVAKHSKTAYKIISEHLHCTVCHQIPLLGLPVHCQTPLWVNLISQYHKTGSRFICTMLQKIVHITDCLDINKHIYFISKMAYGHNNIKFYNH